MKEYLAFATRIFLVIFLLTSVAHARFMLEPRLISTSGEFGRGGESGVINGRGYGINMGYMGDYFMAGISIDRIEMTSDDSLTPHGYEKYNSGGVGTYLGFHFMDSIKIWTSYLNSTLEPTSNNDYRYFGQYFSFGLGYRFYKGFIVNIEGFRNHYTQEESDQTGKTSGLSKNIKTEGKNIFLSYLFVF